MPRTPARTINAVSTAMATTPPDGLPADVADVWQRLASAAAESGLFIELDYEAVLTYCYQCALVRRLDKEAAVVPLTIECSQGETIHPVLRMQKEQKALLLSMQKALGLCPAGRKSLKPEVTPQGTTYDSAKEFFGD